ncbi:putative choline kinase 2 [Zea mays]|uniref:Putative choline kinase 2 n=1 Tax=Zea mays TaxID=4577 RepID=A0A3L6EIC8_MAIZE|nr:putative choline kinase 2 [Zea mays]
MTNEGNDPHKVLVRIYGRGVEVFFDRADEVRTFECMSCHGQGPRLLDRFANGRVEEFINAKTLSAVDLRDPVMSAVIRCRHQCPPPLLDPVICYEDAINALLLLRSAPPRAL